MIKYCSFLNYLEDFYQLFVVFNHQNISFTIISNILAGLWRVGGVDSSGQSPVAKQERLNVQTATLSDPTLYNHLF